MASQSPRRFLQAFAAAIVIGLVTMVAINIVIDPFWRFDLVTVPSINGQRPLFANFLRMSKAGVVCRLRPAQIAIGTSRVEIGMDPNHPAWATAPGPVYNYALGGLGLRELSLNLRHAKNAGHVKRAVIGLDFLMFNANREASVFGTEVLDFDEAQLVLGPNDGCWSAFFYNANRFIGPQGLIFSFLTVTHQLKEPNSNPEAWVLYDKDGFRSYFPLALLSVPSSRIFFSDAQEKYYVSKIWRPPPSERYCFTAAGGQNTMDTFRDMVRFARQSNMDARFYLEPLHARMMLALQDAGLWPQFEDWKRGIVTILSEEAQESGKPPFPLWDFSDFNSVTDEHIPSFDDETTRMKWFWEPSHYKKETGDMILDRVLDYHRIERVDPADFGVKLSLENIESWLVNTRTAGRDYVRAEPNEASFVRDVVDRALAGSDGSNCGYYMDELRIASAAVRRGDKESANKAIERAKAIDERDRRRAVETGVAYREPGFDLALQAAEAGKAIPPNLDSWTAYQQRAIERDAAGDYLGAAQDLAHAIRNGPPNAALHYLRGIALLHAINSAEAATEFEAGLKLDPRNAALQHLLNQIQGAPQQTHRTR
jgi:tetratricopeptide (TPR) repeat protein